MASPEGVQVSMESVIAIQRDRISQLTEQNIMLEAALRDRERQINAMQNKD